MEVHLSRMQSTLAPSYFRFSSIVSVISIHPKKGIFSVQGARWILGRTKRTSQFLPISVWKIGQQSIGVGLLVVLALVKTLD